MAPLTVNFALTDSNITQLATQLDIDYDNNGSIDFTTTTPGVYSVTVWITTSSGVQQRNLNIVVQDAQQ